MSNPVDTKVISKLAEILDKNQLTTLNYEDESCKISLTREVNAGVAPAYAPVAQPVAAPVASVATEEEAKETVVDYSNNPNAIKSPMVGVVYLSSNPNSANYVKVGDSVNEGDTLCLIEAMKTFNPVKAPRAGKVVKILVETGDPIEYGEPLIVIE